MKTLQLITSLFLILVCSYCTTPTRDLSKRAPASETTEPSHDIVNPSAQWPDKVNLSCDLVLASGSELTTYPGAKTASVGFTPVESGVRFDINYAANIANIPQLRTGHFQFNSYHLAHGMGKYYLPHVNPKNIGIFDCTEGSHVIVTKAPGTDYYIKYVMLGNHDMTNMTELRVEFLKANNENLLTYEKMKNMGTFQCVPDTARINAATTP